MCSNILKIPILFCMAWLYRGRRFHFRSNTVFRYQWRKIPIVVVLTDHTIENIKEYSRTQTFPNYRHEIENFTNM